MTSRRVRHVWWPALAGGLVLLAFGAPAVAQPTISITSVPAWATDGSIAGRVSGVNFATHRVAVYIQIEGSGWWTKPSFTTPTVPIRSDGTFSADVVGGGLDDRATIYCAAVLGPGVTPPRAAGDSRVPASLVSLATSYRERYGRTVTFAGREWAVKSAPSPVGPGGNYFADDANAVWVDAQGRLHLAVRNVGGRWQSAEVMSLDQPGFGTYWFTTESELEDLDANLTFGAFTWDPYGDETMVPNSLHREIDFEDSRWGQPGIATTSQVVVQPYDVGGNLVRFTIPDLAGAPTLTRFLSWNADRIEFVAARGRHSPFRVPVASLLHRSVYTHSPSAGRHVPTEGRARFHFNLWINRDGAPRNGREAEVVISDFRFSDIAGTFVGGCRVNPPRSMSPLGGSASVGRRLIVGVDNPAGTQPAGSRAALLLGFAPHPAFPCGAPMPGFGMLGTVAELQVDAAAGLVTYASGVFWSGPGSAVQVQLAIPPDGSLAGRSVWAQGALVDTTPGARLPIGITDALEIVIQP